MKIQEVLPEATLNKHGATQHLNFHRGLSTEIEKQLAVAAVAEHQKLNAPKSQSDSPLLNDYLSKPGRWNGPPNGVVPQNESERKLMAACDRENLGFAEKKRRLLALRADMQKLKPATPIKISK